MIQTPRRQRRWPYVHGLVLGLIIFGVFSSVFVSRTWPFSLSKSGAAPLTGLSLPGVGALPDSEPVLEPTVLPETVRLNEEQQAVLAYVALTTETQSTPAASLEAVQPQPTPLSLYQLYTVQEGDTASAIAERFGIGLEYLLANNPDLRDGEFLEVGQILVIPAGDGILHTVRYGENLGDIAARFGVTVDDITGWPGNSIASADEVLENQLIFVPRGTVPQPVLPEPTPEPTPAPVLVAAAPPPPPPQPAATPPPAPPPAPPPPAASGSGLIWPVVGPISSYMDGSHPLGIDIDMYGREGAPIVAATSGTVTFAGGNPCCSYGLYVVIVSPSGIETLYAHLSSIAVSAGQQVSQGQTVGYAGCTGLCTGTHLHFEVIDNGVRVNPLNYLP